MMVEGTRAVEVTYSAADIAALNLMIWRFWAGLIAFFALALIGVPLIFGLIDGYPLADCIQAIDWTFTAIVLAFITTWLVVVTTAGYWWRSRKGLHGPIRFLLSQTGVQFRNREMEGSVFWSAIRSIKMRGDHLFLFVSRRCAFIIPRRAFDSDSDFAEYAASAHEYWAQRHRP